ncbi:uncharacterized protein N7503_004929 [Penicillium pulvis]|uniref:uncharacterized protein n=1 Tax=Penicillium pulvis TaxID=1562058 RepID=UPI0025471FB2|nr:uncharacterized protein N7503_004929 [Penicillium pulvis]KAJ5802479.1 hypothetical protein N7503_004929 [Penicillium pulvis]
MTYVPIRGLRHLCCRRDYFHIYHNLFGTTAAATETTSSVSCSEYYTVVSGDSCSAIEVEYSITFAEFLLWNPSIVSGDSCWAIATAYGISTTDFIDWNPAVGSDCSGLWPDYEYCVAV